ncbi:Cof-type HAD-IIB family hydrolase [Aquibacillus halophilus]|uniref:Cof-type HAD-IIB family hydrolase n=1 Tax=Aquibacillus halophilus TaxID=930132 RepID=A0A6A8DJJ8_9BACI|nr:HAD family hydrolase [Aquibacillus halophilus]MRH44656.1 Cof-type HAD-IIB family hydrolase [Aquibacillus halophilus]
MLKLFVTDLDGTLLENHHTVKEENKRSIQTLIESGVEFAVATGRMDRDIVEILKMMEQTGHRVSQNGGFVFDKTGKLIFSETFTDDLSKRIHQTLSTHSDFYSITTADEVYVTERTPLLEQFEKLAYFPIIEFKDVADHYGSTVFPVKFNIIGETDQIVKIKDIVNQELGQEMESYLSDKYCVDFVPKGISKALGLTHLIDKLNLEASEIAVIGDSHNDIPMLEMTPHSYAMSSALPEVKAKASNVVENVYDAINDLKQKGLF